MKRRLRRKTKISETFNIRIEETVAEDFPVKAESPEAAVLEAKRLYFDGLLVLEPGTVIQRRIECINSCPQIAEDF